MAFEVVEPIIRDRKSCSDVRPRSPNKRMEVATLARRCGVLILPVVVTVELMAVGSVEDGSGGRELRGGPARSPQEAVLKQQFRINV